jgi:hypothetical protein
MTVPERGAVSPAQLTEEEYVPGGQVSWSRSCGKCEAPSPHLNTALIYYSQSKPTYAKTPEYFQLI